VASAEYQRYRAGIARFLELAAELPGVQQDRIREAIRVRLDDEKARAILTSNEPRTAEIGGHFLDELAAAREVLTPDEEGELARIALSRLAKLDPSPLKPSGA
jgi:hypothetical protein